ncbi:MAG: FG-GAP-like repeat-containing protein, partial [Myxococcota bacterium]
GDVDGDGYADVAVGVAFVDAGRVTVFSGRDGQVLWARDGTATGDRFGSALGLVGDVNKDGIADLAVGAFGAGPFGGGLAFVVSGRDGRTIHQLEPVDPAEALVFGQFFASGAGDVDGDGIADVFVGDYAEGQGVRAATGRAYIFSGFTGELIHVFTGFRPGDGLGPGRGIPDVNGDGHNDIIVAAYLNSDAATTAGAAYLFSGRSGALMRTITATLAGDNFGVDALTLGDINHDAIPDFLVTAVGLSFAGTDTGRAYLIAGHRLPCVADVTGNRVVNGADFIRIRRAFGQSDRRFDLNGDGNVDMQDLVVAHRDRGRCPPGVPKKRRWRRK